MLGKAMQFATVCTLAFAICGKANRYEDAAVSQGTTEDLELRFRHETNFKDDLSATSSWCRVRRLAVIPVILSSAVTSDPCADPHEQPAFAPILTNNPLDGTRDMLRPVNANRANLAPNLATPQVFSYDMKLDPIGVSDDLKLISTPADVEAFLERPTKADVKAFSSLNKWKDSDDDIAQLNVLEEYNRQAEGKVAGELKEKLFSFEQAALWGYTHTDADIINHIAMGADKVEFEEAGIKCTLTKEDMLPWLKILNAGLDKMPRAAAGRLYHGVGFNAEGSPGSIAPINGFSSFSEDFNMAKCSAEAKRKDGIEPTIFVMDTHSSGVQLEQIGDISEVVFSFAKFVIEEDSKVQREVEAEVEELWRTNPAFTVNKVQRWEGVPDFKVLVVKEVPTARGSSPGPSEEPAQRLPGARGAGPPAPPPPRSPSRPAPPRSSPPGPSEDPEEKDEALPDQASL